MFGEKEKVLLKLGSIMFYQGEMVLHKDIATGKVNAYEDRLEMKIDMGNSMKTAVGTLTGAAIGGAVGAGIASSGIKKGGTVSWYYKDIANVSTGTWKKDRLLVITMRDGSFYSLYPSVLSAKKRNETVDSAVQLLESKIAIAN